MSNSLHTIMALSFCVLLLALPSCGPQKKDLHKNTAPKKQPKISGAFLAKDKDESPVILEWMKTNIQEAQFSQAMQEIAPIAVLAYWPVEFQFLGEHPELIAQDKYLTQFAPYFQKGTRSVPWKEVKAKIQESIKKIYEMDLSALNTEVLKPFMNDTYYVVVVKDKRTKMPLGFITFAQSAGYTPGSIKVTSFGITPAEQKCGLGKLLISSIFAIAPETKRIFLSTRPTNEKAIRSYYAWGFIKDFDPKPIEHGLINKNLWTYAEYKVERCQKLQQVAATFKKK